MLKKANRTKPWHLLSLLLLALTAMAGLPQAAEAGIKTPEITGLQELDESRVELSLNAPASGRLDGILVERSTRSDGGFTQALTTEGSATSAIDSGLSSGGTYYYRIRSYVQHRGSTEYSDYSNVAGVTLSEVGSLPVEPVEDTTAPSVSITSPSTDTVVSSAQTLTIVASASDDTGVSKVEFYDGASLVGTDTTNTYSTDLAITDADNGTHSITAIAYDTAGNATQSALVTVTVDIATAPTADPYPAPELDSASLEGGNYVLNWTLPDNPTGTPAGGYDIFIDGDDTNTTWRTTSTSQTISGLDTGVAHTFMVEARWTQADPSVFSPSNELTVEAAATFPGDTTAPTVVLSSPSDGTSVTSAQTLTVVADASDDTGVSKVEFYDGASLIGTDTTNTFSTDLAITEADNGTLNITAIAYDAAGNATQSAPVTVTVDIATPSTADPYPAPVLGSAVLEGGKYVLKWTLPANPTGTPDGGYDIFIDGHDTNSTWRTTATSQSISGLDTGVSHTFKLEARWTQADPSVFSRSGELTVTAAEGSTDSGSTDSGSTDSGSTDSGSTDSGSTDSGSTDSGQTADPSLGYLPVFPGAMGFGTETKAGRGGKIIKVTNTNDSGSGSLRAALSASGPRIIVFEVSGTIKLSSPLRVSNPYVTIAGQTAPSPGIQIIGSSFNIATHDVLVQHLCIRPGDLLKDKIDGLQILGSSAYNVVVDHISASWGIDESAATWSTVKDVTISNSMITETLASPYHPEGPHSMGLLIGDHAKNVALLNNLMAHNRERNPRIKGDVSAVVMNNLMYNGAASSYMSIGADTGPNYVSAVGNVFIDGPNSRSDAKAINISGSASSGTKVYQNDNKYSGTLTGGSGYVSTAPIWHKSLKVKDASTVKSFVLANAGSRPADRDSVNERVVFEVQSGGGGVIASQNDVGGYPFYGETVRTFNIPANPNGDDDGDGYTNIEEVLQKMAAQVEK